MGWGWIRMACVTATCIKNQPAAMHNGHTTMNAKKSTTWKWADKRKYTAAINN